MAAELRIVDVLDAAAFDLVPPCADPPPCATSPPCPAVPPRPLEPPTLPPLVPPLPPVPLEPPLPPLPAFPLFPALPPGEPVVSSGPSPSEHAAATTITAPIANA